jgi:hypothetical protein
MTQMSFICHKRWRVTHLFFTASVTLELLFVTFFGVIYSYCQDLYNSTNDVVRVLVYVRSLFFFFLSTAPLMFFSKSHYFENNNLYKKN